MTNDIWKKEIFKYKRNDKLQMTSETKKILKYKTNDKWQMTSETKEIQNRIANTNTLLYLEWTPTWEMRNGDFVESISSFK